MWFASLEKISEAEEEGAEPQMSSRLLSSFGRGDAESGNSSEEERLRVRGSVSSRNIVEYLSI